MNIIFIWYIEILLEVHNVLWIRCMTEWIFWCNSFSIFFLQNQIWDLL